MSINQLGQAKVVVAKDRTTIVEGLGDAQALKNRIAQIKAEMEPARSTTKKIPGASC